MQNPTAFQACNGILAIAQFAEDGRIVCAQRGRQLADAGRSAIEARGCPRHSDFAEGLALKLFEDMIFAHLLILQEFKTAQYWSGRNIVTEQTWQDFARGPFL